MSTASITVEAHKQAQQDNVLRPVWTVARFWGHGGYEWYAVVDDGALLCRKCVRENYRQIVEATRQNDRSGWNVVGVTYSGEMEAKEWCAHCGQSIGPDQP